MSTNSEKDAELLALYLAGRKAKGHDDDPPRGMYVSDAEYTAAGLRAVAAAAYAEGWNEAWDGRMLHDMGIDGYADKPNPYMDENALVTDERTKK